jgi:hypothetical protein
VQGYAGSADKRLAIEKGEIDGECTGWSSLPDDWLREPRINVLVRLLPTLVTGLDASVPYAGDLLRDEGDRKVYDFLTAPGKLGRLFMVSGRVGAARAAMLRQAFDSMVADRTFLDEAQKLRLLVAPVSGAEISQRVAALYAAPAALVARAKAVSGE